MSSQSHIREFAPLSSSSQPSNGSNATTASAAATSTTILGDCTNYIRRAVSQAEILHGLPLNNEYELIPFNHFTFSRVYPIELGLGKRVVEKPIGFKRKDLLDALNRALDSLNKNATATSAKYTLDDFTEGIYRIDPTTGTQYELYFRTKDIRKGTAAATTSHHEHINGHGGVTKLIVMRPFAPLQTVQIESFPKQRDKDKEIVHIILPLSGRTTTFQSFMDKFVKIALKNDRRVHLTVVYFGEDGLMEARSIMSRVLGTKNSGGNASNLKLLALNETFSRGNCGSSVVNAVRRSRFNLPDFFDFYSTAKGLRVGAERVWDKSNKNKDILLFMCDVDVAFSAKFLDRCRWNARPGRKVSTKKYINLFHFLSANWRTVKTRKNRSIKVGSRRYSIEARLLDVNICSLARVHRTTANRAICHQINFILDAIAEYYSSTFNVSSSHFLTNINRMAEQWRTEETRNCTKRECIRTGLPPIRIEKFNGDYMKWQCFRDMFTNIYHNNAIIQESMKFYSLKELLVGDAKREIAGFTVSSDYDDAWKALNDRYENPRYICDAYINEFMNLPAVTDSRNKHRQLFHLVAGTRKLIHLLPSVGVAIDGWDAILVFTLERKLDKETRFEWRMQSQSMHGKNLPRLEDLLEFMKNHAHVMDSMHEIDQ